MLAGLVPPDAVEADDDLREASAHYAEFRLCREMGWTFEDLQRQPARFVRDCFAFIAAEGDARQRLQAQAEAESRIQRGG